MYPANSKQLAAGIHNLSSSTAQIKTLVAHIGTVKDSPEKRKTLNDRIEATRVLAKNTLTLIGQEDPSNPGLTRIKKEYESALLAFQTQSRIYAEKTRQFILAHQTNLEDEDEGEHKPLLGNQFQLQSRALDHDISFNEALIEERDSDLRNIEQSIVDVNEIFRDLGSLVNEQQFQLDNIESNINETVIHLEGATGELRTANRYHKLASKRCWWIMIVAVAVFLFFFLIVI